MNILFYKKKKTPMVRLEKEPVATVHAVDNTMIFEKFIAYKIYLRMMFVYSVDFFVQPYNYCNVDLFIIYSYPKWLITSCISFNNIDVIKSIQSGWLPVALVWIEMY